MEGFPYDPECVVPSDLILNKVLQIWDSVVMNQLASNGCDCKVVAYSSNISNLDCDNEFYFYHEWWVECIYFFMFCTIIVMSIGGNLTVIWIVLWHRRMRNSITNYFLLNLAIADASISVFNVTSSFYYNLYLDWPLGLTYCIFNNFMGVVPTSGSVFTLMAMSLDRFLAIVYPLKRRLSRRKTLIIITGIWSAAVACGIPMLMHSDVQPHFYNTGEVKLLCKYDIYFDDSGHDSRDAYVVYNYFLFAVNYVCPLTVLTLTYIRMGFALWGSQSIGEYRHEDSVRTKRKVVKMMVTVVTIFLICWFPYHAYFTFFELTFMSLPIQLSLHLFLNMYFLAMCSTTVNPIIYCWLNSKFRVGFKYAFRWVPFVRITKEEYMESDLNRDRFTTSSAAYRRRSTHFYKSYSNGSSPPSAHPNRRTTSVCTQMSHAEDPERCEQSMALLQRSICQTNGLKQPRTDEDIAV